ncbi:hypothetical protein N7490_006323 [Penicillium lividum]|nr:hypothetical protein N7490_006323 [Penicillium lividum]
MVIITPITTVNWCMMLMKPDRKLEDPIDDLPFGLVELLGDALKENRAIKYEHQDLKKQLRTMQGCVSRFCRDMAASAGPHQPECKKRKITEC